MSCTIIEKWRENEEAVLRAGEVALERARRAGVPAYYIDRALGDGIVKEYPDGTRQLISVVDGKDVVIGTFGPRG